MIDHYVIGTSSRVSPEADVPVMKIVDEHLRLGGAGNVALNLKKMGANVMCMGYVGDDKIGRKLLSLLNKNDIDTQHIKIIDNYITTLKKRFYSNGSQVLRIDEELLCEGLEENLSEVPLNVSFTEEKVESETVDLENENSNTSEDEKEKHNISDLMTQIEQLKKLAFEKDEEVNNLKNKYKTLYSELNI